MRKGFLGSVSALLTGAGLSLGQSPSPPASLGPPVAVTPSASLGRPVALTAGSKPQPALPQIIAGSPGREEATSVRPVVRARSADSPPPPQWPGAPAPQWPGAVAAAPAVPAAPVGPAAPAPPRPLLAAPVPYHGIPETIGGCRVIAVQDVPPNRLWFSADYLLWWIRDSHLPPLVTTSSSTALNAGALGGPDTHVLFGGETENEERSG